MYPRLSKAVSDYDPSGFMSVGYSKLLNKLKNEGHNIINFQIGCTVKPKGYETPSIVRDELAKATQQKKFCYPGYQKELPYPGAHKASHGIEEEFKQAVIRREKIVHGVNYDLSNVFSCNGASGAISLFYFAVANPKDEWLCCEPIYANYWSLHSYPPFKFKWVGWKQDEEDGWTPDLDELRSKINDKTKVILLVNPCNPTGAVFSDKMLKGIVDIAGEYELLIQVDEVMDLLPLDGSISTSIAQVAGDVPSIVVNSVSKSWLSPGLRVGWLCIHDPEDKILEIRNGMKKLDRVMGPYPIPTPILVAITNVLNKTTDFQEHLKPHMKLVRDRADYAYQRIDEIDALSIIPVKAGPWGFAKYEGYGTVWKDDQEMKFGLLKYRKNGRDRGVTVTAGSTWGPTYGFGHFRIPVYESEDVLEEGFDRLDEFFSERLNSRDNKKL